MQTYTCISLLTDYGLEDGFVAACHGVAAQLAPGTQVIDVTHLVPPGDVRRGGAVLTQTVPYLPPGVHVVVVDPGVGTSRRALAIEAGESIFVGPDNGVLSWPVTALGGVRRVHELTNEQLWLHPVSATFHGRDIFTPVAARLAAGLDLGAVGESLAAEDLVWLSEPVSRLGNGGVDGEVVSMDHFGNLALSVTAGQLDRLRLHPGDEVLLSYGDESLPVPYGETFASVDPDDLVTYVDSAGQMAVAVNGGSAAGRLGLRPGAAVRLAPR